MNLIDGFSPLAVCLGHLDFSDAQRNILQDISVRSETHAKEAQLYWPEVIGTRAPYGSTSGQADADRVTVNARGSVAADRALMMLPIMQGRSPAPATAAGVDTTLAVIIH